MVLALVRFGGRAKGDPMRKHYPLLIVIGSAIALAIFMIFVPPVMP